jgi:hypothetical protein
MTLKSIELVTGELINEVEFNAARVKSFETVLEKCDATTQYQPLILSRARSAIVDTGDSGRRRRKVSLEIDRHLDVGHAAEQMRGPRAIM